MYQLANGSHFRDEDGYFEWWYFHFASADGFTANVVLHETDIFGLKKSPYVSLSYQLAHQKPEYLKAGIPSGSIIRGSTYLTQSDGCFQESKNEIVLRLTFPSGETFKVMITKFAEPLMLNNCVLYQKGDAKSYWRLQVPLGYFKGILKVGGKSHAVEGLAYHDHQWGNILIQDFVSDWVWGHFSSSDGSVVFFAIQTQEGTYIERYVVTLSDSVQASVSPGQIPHLAELASSSKPELWSGKSVVTFPFGTRLVVYPKTLLRSRVNESHKGFVTTYLRWAGEAIVSPKGYPHRGITEYMRIRKDG